MRFTIILFSALFIQHAAYAASFDCAKAGTKIEKMICSNAELSSLDDQLMDAYKKARSNSLDPKSVKTEQRKWLKQRNKCNTLACVKFAYQSRINELDNSDGYFAKQGDKEAYATKGTVTGQIEFYQDRTVNMPFYRIITADSKKYFLGGPADLGNLEDTLYSACENKTVLTLSGTIEKWNDGSLSLVDFTIVDQPQKSFAGPLTLQKKSSVKPGSSMKLFKNYMFGTLHSELEKINGIMDCEEHFESKALCLSDQKFLGINVDLGFRFHNDKLVEVMVVMQSDQIKQLKVLDALSKSFELVLIKNKTGGLLDCFKLSKTASSDKLQSSFAEFESIALASGEITYAFFEKEAIKPLYSSSQNFQNLLEKAPIHLREVDYVLTQDDDGNPYGTISFTVPKAMRLEILPQQNQEEDF